MAFQKENVVIGRGKFNNHATPNGLILHTYFSAVDTHATMELANYFDDFLGATNEDVLVGDLVWARDSSNAFKSYRLDTLSPVTVTPVSVDAPQNPFDQNLNTTDSPTFAKVTTTTGVDFPTSGGTPATLNYFETGSFQFNWTGGFAGTLQQTVNFTRIGNIVVLAFDSTTVAQTGANTATSGTDLPVQLRSGMQFAFYNPSVVDNTVPVNARFVLQVDGSAIFSTENGGNFSGTGNLQLQESSVTYLI